MSSSFFVSWFTDSRRRLRSAVVLSLSLALLCRPGHAHADATNREALTPQENVKLLTIGNSFADNAVDLLPEFARAGGKRLTVCRANVGGNSLAQHVSYVKAFEKDPTDPKGHPYKNLTDPRTGQKNNFSLRECLESQDWDVVTIQQVSNLSFRPETYQPFANILIDYIHRYAPHAKILIYETWAYPDDYFAKFKAGNLDQKAMYHQLRDAYQKLSTETGLPLIPVGDAFQAARAEPASLSLNVPGDKHANVKGKYLAAAVFYETIYGVNVEDVAVSKEGISSQEAKLLRHVAHQSILACHGSREANGK